MRYTTPNQTLPTRYTYTGQYSYINDEATDLGSAGFGLMFYNARWFDPLLGRFTSADTFTPAGPQGLDRYAYVNNSPINYVDPTGHRCEEGDDKPGGYCWSPSELLKSAVVIIFGKPGKGENTVGFATGASGGVGVVVGDKQTIVTAEHVYQFNLSDHDTVVPADVATNYDSKSGQSVITSYVTERYEGNKLSGYTLHTLTTVTYEPLVWQTPYGRQLMISNPDNVLNHGDSGGGVFYDGQLIGVNSYNDFDPTKERTTVAPLCVTWYGWPC